MTLVVETEKNITSESESALRKLLPQEDSGFSDDLHFFRYFTVDDTTDQNTLIITVMKIPGVLSAYFRSSGMPPR